MGKYQKVIDYLNSDDVEKYNITEENIIEKINELPGAEKYRVWHTIPNVIDEKYEILTKLDKEEEFFYEFSKQPIRAYSVNYLTEDEKDTLLKQIFDSRKLYDEDDEKESIKEAFFENSDRARERIDLITKTDMMGFLEENTKYSYFIIPYLKKEEIEEVIMNSSGKLLRNILCIESKDLESILNSEISEEVKELLLVGDSNVFDWENKMYISGSKLQWNNLNDDVKEMALDLIQNDLYEKVIINVEDLNFGDFKKLLCNKEFYTHIINNEDDLYNYINKKTITQIEQIADLIVENYGAKSLINDTKNIFYKCSGSKRLEYANTLTFDEFCSIREYIKLPEEKLKKFKEETLEKIKTDKDFDIPSEIDYYISREDIEKDLDIILKECGEESVLKRKELWNKISYENKEKIAENCSLEVFFEYREVIEDFISAEKYNELYEGVVNKIEKGDTENINSKMLDFLSMSTIQGLIKKIDENLLRKFAETDNAKYVFEIYEAEYGKIEDYEIREEFRMSYTEYSISDLISVIKNEGESYKSSIIELKKRLSESPDLITEAFSNADDLYSFYYDGERRRTYILDFVSRSEKMINSLDGRYDTSIVKCMLERNPESVKEIFERMNDEKMARFAPIFLKYNEEISQMAIERIRENKDSIKFYERLPEYLYDLEDDEFKEEIMTIYLADKILCDSLDNNDKFSDVVRNKAEKIVQEKRDNDIDYILDSNWLLYSQDNEYVEKILSKLSIDEKIKAYKNLYINLKRNKYVPRDVMTAYRDKILNSIFEDKYDYKKDEIFFEDMNYMYDVNLRFEIKFMDKIGVENIINNYKQSFSREEKIFLISKISEDKINFEKIDMSDLFPFMCKLDEYWNDYESEDDKNKLIEYISEEKYNEIEENGWKILLNTSKEGLKTIMKEDFEFFEDEFNKSIYKQFFVYKLYEKGYLENNKEKVKEILERNDNDFFISNISPDLFRPEFKNYNIEFIELLCKNKNMLDDLLNEENKEKTHNFNIMMNSLFEDEPLENVTGVIETLYYKMFLRDEKIPFIEEKLTVNQAENLKEYILNMQINHAYYEKDEIFFIPQINTLEDLENYRENLNATCDKKFDETDSISEKFNILANKFYSSSLRELKDTSFELSNATYSLREINPEYKETEEYQFVDAINELLSVYNSKNIDKATKKDIVNSLYKELGERQNAMFKKEDFVILKEKCKDDIGKELSDSLFKIGDDDEPTRIEEFYGNNIPVFEMDGEFKILLHSLGAYGEFDEYYGYEDSWNKNENISNQRVCCSLVSNNFIGTAPIGSTVIGFDSFGNKALKGEGPKDLYSYNNSIAIASERNLQFYTSSDLIDATYSRYNEVNISRKELRDRDNTEDYNIQPSYVILFDEGSYEYNDDNSSYDYYVNEALRCASDFGIPIVYIDKEKYAQKNKEVLNEKIANYKETGNIDELFEITKKFNKSCCGDLYRGKNNKKEKGREIGELWNDKISSITSRSKLNLAELRKMDRFVKKEKENYEESLNYDKRIKGISKKNLFDIEKNMLYYNQNKTNEEIISTAKNIEFTDEELKDINWLKNKLKNDKKLNLSKRELEKLDRKITYSYIQMDFMECTIDQKHEFFDSICDSVKHFLNYKGKNRPFHITKEGDSRKNGKLISNIVSNADKIEKGEMENLNFPSDFIESLNKIKEECEKCYEKEEKENINDSKERIEENEKPVL